MRTVLILTVICSMILGCKSKEKSAATAVAGTVEEKTSVRPIITDPEVHISTKEIDFTVTRWEISGHRLTVDVRYGGGCRDHGWDMFFSGGIMKSLPPQALLHLRHTVADGPDPCRGMPTETLEFDLSSLKGVASGELVVKWGGDPQRSAVYRF
jgi:hypothetical protein